VAVSQRVVKTKNSNSPLACDIAASRALGIFFTAYRLVQIPIPRTSLVSIEIPFDLPYPPNCVILRFLRTAELLHNTSNQTSHCPDICSRPKNLTSMAFLCGHTVAREVYNQKEIDGLEHNQMTEKKYNWIRGLVDSGFMSAGQAANALQIERKSGGGKRQNVGYFNVFPISVRSDLIRQSYSYYNAGSTNIASTLRVELKFVDEGGPTGSWSLLAIGSYLARGTMYSDKEAVKFELMF